MFETSNTLTLVLLKVLILFQQDHTLVKIFPKIDLLVFPALTARKQDMVQAYQLSHPQRRQQSTHTLVVAVKCVVQARLLESDHMEWLSLSFLVDHAQ